MFRSQYSGKVALPKVSPVRVVIATRDVTYEYLDKEGNLKTSYGKEIVKELVVLPDEVDSVKRYYEVD